MMKTPQANNRKRTTHLMLFSHPDDELWIIQRMKKIARQGDRLVLRWMTAGAKDEKSLIRRQESLRLLAYHGLGDADTGFWSFEDGELINQMPALYEAVSGALDTLSPDSVFVPAYEGAHPDHDTLNFIVSEALGRNPSSVRTAYEYPTYNGWKCIYMRMGVLVPHEEKMQYTPMSLGDWFRFWRSLCLFRSQQPMLLIINFLFGFQQLRQQLSRGESFRPLPKWCYTELPHPGRQAYELFVSVKPADFHAAVRQFQMKRK
ncbi:MAG: PIG-L family deacetylase [bacterium]